jgi:hypothetical protein
VDRRLVQHPPRPEARTPVGTPRPHRRVRVGGAQHREQLDTAHPDLLRVVRPGRWPHGVEIGGPDAHGGEPAHHIGAPPVRPADVVEQVGEAPSRAGRDVGLRIRTLGDADAPRELALELVAGSPTVQCARGGISRRRS